MAAMKKYILAALAIATCSMVHASDWTRTKYSMYPPMNEFVTTLRVEYNWTGGPVSVATEAWEEDVNSYCSGSSSTLPPWSSYFAAIFNIDTPWSGTTSGTVDAMKKRIWELWCINTGGDERWFKANEDPNTHERLRIDRDDCFYVTYQLNLSNQGGSGN